MTDPFAVNDAAYVLGALDEPDRRAFEAHLVTCAECSASVAALRDLPALLATVPADEFATLAEEPPPDTLLPRLQREVRRIRRHRRVLVGSLAAAAAAVVVAVTGVVAYDQGRSGQGAAHGVAMAKLDQVAPIDGKAQVVADGTGAVVTIWCTYGANQYSAGTYQLVVHSRSGRPDQVLGSWVGVPGKTITISAPTTWPRSDIARVDVVYGSETVLTLAE